MERNGKPKVNGNSAIINMDELLFLKSIVSNVPNMIFVKDAESLRFCLLNQAGEKLLGLKEADLIGKSDHDFFPKEQADFFNQKDRSVLQGGKMVDIPEEPIETPLGPRWLHTQKVPVMDAQGRPRFLLGISEDITERKKLADELDQSRARSDLLIFSSELGLWDWNLVTNEVFADDRVCGMLGYRLEEIGTNFQNWEPLWHPEDVDHLKNTVKRYLDGDIPYYEIKFRMKHKQGHWVPILSKGKVTQVDISGKPVRISGTHFDFTNMQKMEDALAKQILISQHKTRLASIGELAAGIGHEINNPLMIAMGYLGKLAKDYESSAEASGIVESTKQALRRVAKIVSGLRTLARVDKVETEPVDLKGAITQCVQFVKEIYSKIGIRISLELPSDECWVLGTPGRIEQVIMNLLSNAKDAMEKTETRDLSVQLFQKGNSHFVHVRDTGTGIPSEIQERIFDGFFSTKDVGQGLGLGLSIALAIMRELGGEIRFESGSSGTVFQLMFPRLERNSVPQPPAVGSVSSAETTDFNGLSVLVVDDEPELRAITRELLEDLGCRVDDAENGLVALQKLRSSTYEVVLTDIQMPKMDGFSLIREMIQLNLKEMPFVVVITGGITEQMKNQPLEVQSAVIGSLAKPFYSEEIVGLLQRIPRKVKAA